MPQYDVQLADLKSVPLAVVRRQARSSELATVVPQGCGVVWALVRARNLHAGRNVAVYWDGSIRLEVGVELEGAFEERSDLFRSATPAGLAASVAHFGPYAPGTYIKLTQALGATPSSVPFEGMVDWHVTVRGDLLVTATDAAGNTATATCTVPPNKK